MQPRAAEGARRDRPRLGRPDHVRLRPTIRSPTPSTPGSSSPATPAHDDRRVVRIEQVARSGTTATHAVIRVSAGHAGDDRPIGLDDDDARRRTARRLADVRGHLRRSGGGPDLAVPRRLRPVRGGPPRSRRAHRAALRAGPARPPRGIGAARGRRSRLHPPGSNRRPRPVRRSGLTRTGLRSDVGRSRDRWNDAARADGVDPGPRGDRCGALPLLRPAAVGMVAARPDRHRVVDRRPRRVPSTGPLRPELPRRDRRGSVPRRCGCGASPPPGYVAGLLLGWGPMVGVVGLICPKDDRRVARAPGGRSCCSSGSTPMPRSAACRCRSWP